MKRIKSILIVVICVIMTTSVCYAETKVVGNEIVSPYYLVTKKTVEVFSINSSGVASMTASLSPMSKDEVDKVKITLIIKKSNGTSVYSKTYDASWSNLHADYRLTKTYQLPSKGIYSFNAVYKCYKNNNLIETITTDYILDAYS